jgi:hypothetical protein
MYTAVIAKSKNRNRWRQWHLLRRAAVLGLFAHALAGCLLIDSGEGKDQPGTKPTPAVQVYEYRVTDVVSGFTYAAGCNANSGDTLDSLTAVKDLAITAKVPLDVDYLVEITAVRRHDGSLTEHDESYFCQLTYEATAVHHINPSCYQLDPFGNEHELIEASLVDADGNTMSSTTLLTITGTTADIQSFKLRSHAYRNVYLNHAGPPCNGSSSYSLLLLGIQQP